MRQSIEVTSDGFFRVDAACLFSYLSLMWFGCAVELVMYATVQYKSLRACEFLCLVMLGDIIA